MNIFRPVWSEGAYLSPQQFQQESQWQAYLTDCAAHISVAHPWGVLHCQLDEALLGVGRLALQQLIVRFADGTLINSQVADLLPPPCELTSLSGRESATVVLALPLLSAQGNNIGGEGQGDRPLRYGREWIKVQDLLGEGCSEIAVLRHALSLRYEHQENGEYLTLPLLRLVRDGQGKWQQDKQFVPPLLAFSASPWLVNQLTQLTLRIGAKRRRLMSLRRESNQRMADFAVADVSLFWLLNALNSHEPILNEVLNHPQQHPERIYAELTRLAGSLLTFSLEHDIDAIPVYDHLVPTAVFPPLFSLLNVLLEASLPSRVMPIELSKDGAYWKGDLHDPRLREEADLYLSVRSTLPAYEVQAQIPLQCKVGSPDDVADVVNVALSGVPLITLSHVPASIPIRLENQYFALDLNNDAARAMLAAGSCAFYVPGTLGEIQLELFAVLRS
jgi:type VI secretion system protein ImpJ